GGGQGHPRLFCLLGGSDSGVVEHTARRSPPTGSQRDWRRGDRLPGEAAQRHLVALPHLGSPSVRLAGARPLARADGVSATDLHTFYTGGTIHRLGALAQGEFPGFSILCFLNRTGILGLVYRVHSGPGPRTTLSSERLAALPAAWFMVVSGHARHARPAGI